MKHLVPLLLFGLLLTGCIEDRCTDTVTYTAYEPVVLVAGAWRNDDFPATEGRTVCDPSAFYVYGDLLFVLDRQAGLHIIDNRDNANPVPLKFIEIPGGEGMAVRNDVLYVNQYIDLLAFDLSDPANPELLSRTKDVFDPYSDLAAGIHGTGDITIDYVETPATMTIDCSSPYWGTESFRYNDFIYFSASGTSSSNGSNNSFSVAATAPELVGTGGSLARFTINRGTLYAVDANTLHTFSLSDPAAPAYTGTTALGWGIETIFPYRDMLFIGANSGMHIYGLDDPLKPEHFSTFEHVRSCDPVVVQNDIAYVTMWGGSSCGDQGDQLYTIDVSDPRQPTQLQRLPMNNSHGLGVDGEHLYLCAGPDGLQVYDLTEEGLLGELVHTAADFPAKDVIVLPQQRELIVLGWEQAGIRQYDYDAAGTPTHAGDLAICQ